MPIAVARGDSIGEALWSISSGSCLAKLCCSTTIATVPHCCPVSIHSTAYSLLLHFHPATPEKPVRIPWEASGFHGEHQDSGSSSSLESSFMIPPNIVVVVKEDACSSAAWLASVVSRNANQEADVLHCDCCRSIKRTCNRLWPAAWAS